mgnify:FL=1
MKMSRKSGGLFKFIAGVGIGVGAGMLLAPKKGEELRKDLKKKIDELLNKAKEIDIKEVSDDFVKRINELKDEIEDLDKEKALAIAKKKGEELKVKANELLDLAREKGTPVVEKAVEEVRQKAIQVTKEVLKKLEKEETKEEK